MRQTYREKALREAKEHGGVAETHIGTRNPAVVWVTWNDGLIGRYKAPDGTKSRALLTELRGK